MDKSAKFHISVVIWIIFAVLMGIVCAAIQEGWVHPMLMHPAVRSEAKKDLFKAIDDGDYNTVCEIIETYPSLVNESRWEHDFIATLLLTPSETPLFRACWQEKEDRKVFIKLLVENGADVNKKGFDNSDRYPLLEVLAYNDIESAEYLIENGADLLVSEKFSVNVPYMIATRKADIGDIEFQSRCLKILKAAVNKGALVFPQDRESYVYGSGAKSVYGLAACSNQALIVEYFLETGINSVDEIAHIDNKTALIVAAENNAYDVVKVLLDYGADKSITDNEGKTAYDYAVLEGNQEIADMLK